MAPGSPQAAHLSGGLLIWVMIFVYILLMLLLLLLLYQTSLLSLNLILTNQTGICIHESEPGKIILVNKPRLIIHWRHCPFTILLLANVIGGRLLL